MKKSLIVLALLLSACGPTAREDATISNFQECIDAGNPAMESYPRQCRAGDQTFTENIEKPIETLARETLTQIKNKDLAAIAQIVHPQKGLRFSPYIFTNPAIEQNFTATQLSELDPETVYNWGIYDGSGEPIELNFNGYYEKFIYPKDFLATSDISISTTGLKSHSSMIDNSFDIYPGATIVQYYLNINNDPFDWASLRLVFEKEAGNWYLTGIIHDQWTI